MYDDIETFLYSKASIDNDTKFLVNYISNYMVRSSNREKIDQYYEKFPEILDRILGTSNKSFKQFKYEHKQNSLIDKLTSEQTNFFNFSMVMHIFLPCDGNIKNIFSSVCSPADNIPSYKISAHIISKNIEKLLYQKKSDYILYSFSIFQELTKSIEYQKENLEKNILILSVFEYFIIFFLLSIKEMNYSKLKVNLSEVNMNFSNLGRIESSYLHSELENSRIILHEMDLKKSLIYNFYFINLKHYLEFFSRSNSWSDYDRFKLIISAIEFVWLSDYVLVPNANEISNNPREDYFYIFSNPKAYAHSTIPNILLLDCLFLAIKTLQTKNFLYTENNKTIRFSEEPLLFKIQRPLFYFFKTCFIRFSAESMNLETSLHDITKLWLKYITPWTETTFGNISKKNINDTRFINESYYESRLNVYDTFFVSYIFNNILFYTELLNDYIIAFSKLNTLKNSEIIQLRDILQLFRIQDGYIINGLILISNLEEVSLGKKYNTNMSNDIENHIKFIGSNKSNIFPFLNPDNQRSAKQILNTIQTWIQKLDTKSSMNDESSNFLTLLRDIKTILSQLYRIESDDYNEFNQFSTGATNIETQRISDRVSVKNPWLKKVTNEELRILYHFFKFMSYQIDRKIRGIPIRYDRKGNMEPPITNLRFLCNYYTMISTAIFIICTYLVVLILIKLIRR